MRKTRIPRRPSPVLLVNHVRAGEIVVTGGDEVDSGKGDTLIARGCERKCPMFRSGKKKGGKNL